MATIPFWKMHGAGNDFIMVDDRARTFPVADRAWMARLGLRKTGVGCDGFMLIQPPVAGSGQDFAMRFFNPDGSEAEMCGNGARCVARLAAELGIAGSPMRFSSVAGEIRADLVGERVRLHMTPPVDWRMDLHLPMPADVATATGNAELRGGFVNSGVPHVVIPLASPAALAACDLRRLGAALRYHDAFKPRGTNANFIAVTGPHSLDLRTYERGVEDETLACGTGVVASALVAARLGLVTGPVALTVASGDVLEVDFRLAADGTATAVTLLGPAVHVYRGELPLP